MQTDSMPVFRAWQTVALRRAPYAGVSLIGAMTRAPSNNASFGCSEAHAGSVGIGAMRMLAPLALAR